MTETEVSSNIKVETAQVPIVVQTNGQRMNIESRSGGTHNLFIAFNVNTLVQVSGFYTGVESESR